MQHTQRSRAPVGTKALPPVTSTRGNDKREGAVGALPTGIHRTNIPQRVENIAPKQVVLGLRPSSRPLRSGKRGWCLTVGVTNMVVFEPLDSNLLNPTKPETKPCAYSPSFDLAVFRAWHIPGYPVAMAHTPGLYTTTFKAHPAALLPRAML